MRLFEITMLVEDRVTAIRQKFDAPLRQKEPNIEPATIIDKAIDSDPTKNKKYTQWLLTNYLNGNVELEDLYKSREDLTDFEKMKNQLPQQDINQYTPDSLYKAIKELTPVASKRQEKQQIKTEGTDVIAKGNDGVLLKLKTKEAACFYGRETRWCTAATEADNRFDEYNNQAPVYVFMAKDGRKFQFWIGMDELQFMDEKDRPINIREVAKNYPTLQPFVKKLEGQIKKSPRLAYRYAKKIIKGRFPAGEKAIASKPEFAYRYASTIIRGRWPEGEKAMASDPEFAYRYAKKIIKGRWPEAEKTIASDPYYAQYYARDVIDGRWPEGEKTIASNPEFAYRYASNIIKGRWPEGEKAIASDPEFAYYYAAKVIKGRWPEAEKAIASDPEFAYYYAAKVIKGRWPEAEKTIASDPAFAYRYASNIIKGRWPEAEKTIASDPTVAHVYAAKVIKGRWPEGEKAIASNPTYAYFYAVDVIKGRFPAGEAAISKEPVYQKRYLAFLRSK